MIKAKYTVVLKTLLDEPETANLINKALSTYPLYEKKSIEEFQPSFIPTREELNRKLLNHYKYCEIGFETVGRFIDELEITMNEIMPYYNQLFFSADQDYNILFNVDYSRTISRDLDGSGTDNVNMQLESNQKSNTEGITAASSTVSTNDTISTNDNSESNNKQVNSKTPQSELSITASDIDSVAYADDVTWNKSNNNASGTSSNSGSSETSNESSNSDETISSNKEITTSEALRSNTEKEETLEKTIGNFGVVSSQDLIEKYRNLIINIEQQIFNNENITNLFMNIL